jgi:hypothetical protein
MSGILPFNFGMDYSDWLALYEKVPELVGSDPKTWSQDQIDEVNKRAKEENTLANRLLALPDDEFYKECKKLEQYANGN